VRNKLKPVRDQVIVITGASSGNGLATAREAVRRGAAVVLVARNEAALEQIADELRADGGRAAVCAVDVADPASAQRIAQAAVDAFGGFDTWVNGAAVTSYGTLEQLGIDEQRRVIDVTYFGMLQGSLAALAHLRRRGGGAIVNVGSILSDRAVIKQPAYCAAKAAVRAMTENLRMDIEREGLPISVTLIKPAGIHTPFPEHGRNHMDEPPRIPQILYAPELVADAILFAAEHPRRQIYVGGYGYMLSLLARLFPRITDRVMEAALVRTQQAPGQPGDPAARDNLFAPRKDGSAQGSQPFAVKRFSLFLEAQKHPLAASALLGAGALAAAAATRRPTRRRAAASASAPGPSARNDGRAPRARARTR
jgi:short-subunit dehydrogenase